MILGEVSMLAKHLRCNVCLREWYSIASRLPECCPNRECRSREWNGVKKKRIPAPKPRINLPKPQRIKTEEFDDEF
jgi:hypothetical protein